MTETKRRSLREVNLNSQDSAVESMTKDQTQELLRRQEEEEQKGGKFELLSEVIEGDLLIGVYRPDQKGYSPSFNVYMMLLRREYPKAIASKNPDGTHTVYKYGRSKAE